MGAEIRVEEIKQLELDILRYIREKCRENGLRYYMMFGTLIGAVRHKGFIPWDDDVDIAMFRADFMKLLEIVSADQNSPYEVVSMYNVKDFAFPLAKVVDTRTKLVQHGAVGTHEKLGAYVDVFLIDNVPDDEREYASLIRRVKSRSRRWYMSQRCIALRRGKVLRDVCVALATLPYKLRPAMKAAQQLDQVCAAYNHMTTKRAGVIMSVDNKTASTLTQEEWAKVTDVEFEGERFCAVSCWDELLRRTYGDYMKLPSKQEQVAQAHSFTAFWRDGEDVHSEGR